MARKSDLGPSRYMPPTEVAHELGISRASVYNLIRSGQLVGVNVSATGRSQLRVSRDSFNDYCARIEAEAARRFGAA